VFTFELWLPYPDGSEDIDTFMLHSGECTAAMPIPDGATGHVVEDVPDGWVLVSITRTTSSGDEELSGNGIGTADNPAECPTSGGMGCTLTFHDQPNTPPTGKTFTIGPSSMEGHLKIPPGSWFNGGYSFKSVSGSHAATSFTVTAKVEVPVTCPYGGGPGGTILIPLGTRTYNVPAGNTNWLPTGDANSILSWMGAVMSPDLCGGFPMDNAKGAIFTATVSQDPPSGSLVDFRFKYRDPAAKGKTDTNCTDPNAPKRDDAATCGASWSQTVRDP
jgi:hypothetical protein